MDVQTEGRNGMLDQKDLELLQGMMESVVGSRIAESEDRKSVV